MIDTEEGAADYAVFGRIVLLWGHVEIAIALVNIIVRLTHPHFADSQGGRGMLAGRADR
jgi:hypothetical protein